MLLRVELAPVSALRIASRLRISASVVRIGPYRTACEFLSAP